MRDHISNSQTWEGRGALNEPTVQGMKLYEHHESGKVTHQNSDVRGGNSIPTQSTQVREGNSPNPITGNRKTLPKAIRSSHPSNYRPGEGTYRNSFVGAEQSPDFKSLLKRRPSQVRIGYSPKLRGDHSILRRGHS